MFSLLSQGSDESFTSHYLLSDNMYTTAEIKPSSVVYLWLGVSTGTNVQ